MLILHGVHLQNARKWSAQWCCFYLSCRNEHKYNEVDWVRHKNIHVINQHVHTRSKRNTHCHLQGPVLRRSTRKHNPNAFPLKVQLHPKYEAGGHLQCFTAAFSYITWAEKSISFGSSTLPPSSLFRKSSKLPVDEEERISAVQTCTHTKKSKQNANDHSDWQGREGGPGEMTALPLCEVTVPFPDVGQTQFPLTCPLWPVVRCTQAPGKKGWWWMLLFLLQSICTCHHGTRPAGLLWDRNQPVLPAVLSMPTAGTHPCPAWLSGTTQVPSEDVMNQLCFGGKWDIT